MAEVGSPKVLCLLTEDEEAALVRGDAELSFSADTGDVAVIPSAPARAVSPLPSFIEAPPRRPAARTKPSKLPPFRADTLELPLDPSRVYDG